MEDIELVVKIPKELYEAYKGRPPMLGDAGMDMIAQAIANGTPLPKGHGRLIDADRLKEEFKEHHDFYVNAYGEFKNLPTNDKSRVDEITNSIASVVNSPTIIEADKESD